MRKGQKCITFYLRMIVLFMCKASLEQSVFLQETLKIYGEATGQFLNLAKSSITFGSNVNLVIKLNFQNR